MGGLHSSVGMDMFQEMVILFTLHTALATSSINPPILSAFPTASSIAHARHDHTSP